MANNPTQWYEYVDDPTGEAVWRSMGGVGDVTDEQRQRLQQLTDPPIRGKPRPKQFQFEPYNYEGEMQVADLRSLTDQMLANRRGRVQPGQPQPKAPASGMDIAAQLQALSAPGETVADPRLTQIQNQQAGEGRRGGPKGVVTGADEFRGMRSNPDMANAVDRRRLAENPGDLQGFIDRFGVEATRDRGPGYVPTPRPQPDEQTLKSVHDQMFGAGDKTDTSLPKFTGNYEQDVQLLVDNPTDAAIQAFGDMHGQDSLPNELRDPNVGPSQRQPR